MKYPNGSISPGPWSQLVRILKCPCSDGKRRSATVTGQPTTAWSVPAKCQVKGRWVSGFISMTPTYEDGVSEGYFFTANPSGKHGSMLPTWSLDMHRSFSPPVAAENEGG